MKLALLPGVLLREEAVICSEVPRVFLADRFAAWTGEESDVPNRFLRWPRLDMIALGLSMAADLNFTSIVRKKLIVSTWCS